MQSRSRALFVASLSLALGGAALEAGATTYGYPVGTSIVSVVGPSDIEYRTDLRGVYMPDSGTPGGGSLTDLVIRIRLHADDGPFTIVGRETWPHFSVAPGTTIRVVDFRASWARASSRGFASTDRLDLSYAVTPRGIPGPRIRGGQRFTAGGARQFDITGSPLPAIQRYIGPQSAPPGVPAPSPWLVSHLPTDVVAGYSVELRLLGSFLGRTASGKPIRRYLHGLSLVFPYAVTR